MAGLVLLRQVTQPGEATGDSAFRKPGRIRHSTAQHSTPRLLALEATSVRLTCHGTGGMPGKPVGPRHVDRRGSTGKALVQPPLTKAT